MKHFIGLFAFLALFGRCAESPKSDTSGLALTSGQENKNPEEQIRGLLTMNNGHAMFSDQLNNTTYKVVDKTQKLDQAYQDAAAPCHYPGEYVYTVLTGKFTGSDRMAPTGFEVYQIDTISAKNPENLAIIGVPFEFWCNGNEPFWSIQVSYFEGGIFYENMSDGTAWFCPWIAPTANAAKDTWTYTIPQAMGKNDAMEIRIKKETCDDGMSEQVYDYSVELKVHGATLKGVAIRGSGKIMGSKAISH